MDPAAAAMIRASVLVALVGCGRIGFDDGGRSDAESGDAACVRSAAWTPPEREPNLASSAEDWEPAVSPDGLTMVFGTFRPSPLTYELMIAHADEPFGTFGPPQRIVFGTMDAIGVFGPAWSRDGTRLYFSDPARMRYVAAYHDGIFDAPTPTTLLLDDLAWIDDTSTYGTVEVGTDLFELRYHYVESGTWFEQLLPAAYWIPGTPGYSNGWPSYHAASETLYFEHQEGGATQIARASRAGGVLADSYELVTELGALVGDPDISGDGNTIYFALRTSPTADNDIYKSTHPCE